MADITYSSGDTSGYYKVSSGVLTLASSSSYTCQIVEVTDAMDSVAFQINSISGISSNIVFCGFADASHGFISKVNVETGTYDIEIPSNAKYIYLSFFGSTYNSDYVIKCTSVSTYEFVDSTQLDSDLTSIANAIRTKGGTSSQLAFPSGFVTAISNIPSGGSSRYISGTFTPSSSEKGTAKDISLPYSGTGYPLVCVIYPSAGAYKSGSDAYTKLQRYGLTEHVIIKANASASPDYADNVEKNQAVAFAIYKNSTTDPANYSNGMSSVARAFYSSGASGNTAANCSRFKSATTLSVFIADTSYGFIDDIEYAYEIIYSS